MGSLVSKVSNAVFGDPADALAPLQNFKPRPFSTRGLSGTFEGNTFKVTPSTDIVSNITSAQTASQGRADEFRNLIPITQGAFGRITESGVNKIRDASRRAVGNLRENLARRRVAGSSFATDALARAEAEFTREEEDFRAKTSLEEIDATARLIDMSARSEIEAAQIALNQLNFESELGANFNSQINQIVAQNQALQSQILTDFAAARGNLVGTIAGGATAGALARG